MLKQIILTHYYIPHTYNHTTFNQLREPPINKTSELGFYSLIYNILNERVTINTRIR